MTQVVALRDGFYRGQRKRPGATFSLREGDKIGKWMEEVEAAPVRVKPTPTPATPVNTKKKAAPAAEDLV